MASAVQRSTANDWPVLKLQKDPAEEWAEQPSPLVCEDLNGRKTLYNLIAMSDDAVTSIFRWARSKPAWVSDAARRVILYAELTDDDVQEVLQLCRKHHGLPLPKGNEHLEPVKLEERHIPSNEAEDETTHLLGIKQPTGANALSPSSELTFESAGLTVIYGDNGSGKSGYARILKRACRARDRGEAIKPDIYSATPPAAAKATLPFTHSGAEASHDWSDADDTPATELSRVCIFDERSASVHIDAANDVAFRPYGLDVPDRLSTLFETVGQELASESATLGRARAGVFLNPTWKQTTSVGKALSQLSPSTDLASIKKLAELSDVERKRLEQLRKDLASDPATTAKQLRTVVQSSRTLWSRVSAAVNGTTDTRLGDVRLAARDAEVVRAAATAAAAGRFDEEPLPGIDSDAWRELWRSARGFSEADAYPERDFPVTDEDARCVLCQQPLGTEGLSRMQRFDEFVKDDTEVRAREAEQLREERVSAVNGLDLRCRSVRDQLGSVAVESSTVAQDARRAIVLARLRRRAALRSLLEDPPRPAPVATDPTEAIDKLIASLETRADELDAAASGEQRAVLRARLDELADRERLKELIPTIEAEVERLKSAAKLTRAINAVNTRPVTELGNALAKELITDRLRDRFADELNRLAEGRVRVELVQASGRRGNPKYQVKLVVKPNNEVSSILSEGERKCVAIASFLTELSTASHKSTIVFDDPVSSLDHRWRLRVAKRLVEEAKARPVVVLTHDIVFVHDLDHSADKEGIGCTLRTVKRVQRETGIVADGLPWKGKRVEQRIDELEKRARACKDLHDQHDEDGYAKSARDLYDDLRATWERALEEVAFQRIVVRHRDYVDSKNLKKVSVLTEADCDAFRTNYGKCHDVITGHDPSPGRNAEVPPPSDLGADIQALKDWVMELRTRQKVFDKS